MAQARTAARNRRPPDCEGDDVDHPVACAADPALVGLSPSSSSAAVSVGGNARERVVTPAGNPDISAVARKRQRRGPDGDRSSHLDATRPKTRERAIGASDPKRSVTRRDVLEFLPERDRSSHAGRRPGIYANDCLCRLVEHPQALSIGRQA
jgi:hypothetical protein